MMNNCEHVAGITTERMRTTDEFRSTDGERESLSKRTQHKISQFADDATLTLLRRDVRWALEILKT